jgi:hypothetical protein
LSDIGKGNPRFGRNILLLISGVQTIFTVSHAARFTFGFVAFALPGVENPQKNRDEVPFALNTLRENWLRS